jgi:hypothetical protein
VANSENNTNRDSVQIIDGLGAARFQNPNDLENHCRSGAIFTKNQL